MKVLFLGTSAFACPSLKALLASGHEILAVVTQPDRPQGRGQKILPSPIKSLALANHLPLFQPVKIGAPSAVEVLRTFAPDLLVVVAYGQIIPPPVLSLPPGGCLNLHASLLPKYRGAAPIARAILAGESETGVTTMFIDPGMDTGPILLTQGMNIQPEDTAGTLHDRLAQAGADLLLRTLEGLEKKTIVPQRQNHSQASYAPKIQKAEAEIIWENPAAMLFNLLRAFDPSPGAFTICKGRLLKLFRPLFIKEEEATKGVPGTIVQVTTERLVIATSQGFLGVGEVQLENRGRMSVAEFLRGKPLKSGIKLGT